jgi:predicted nucleic acid-binding protein
VCIKSNHPEYYIPVSEYLAMCLGTRQATPLTIVIVTAEFGVLPKRTGNLTLLNNLTNLLHELKFQVLEINQEMADLSSSLRALYTFLKGIDALQVAAAIHTGCQEFYTNDKPLNNIQEIKVVMASKQTK